MGLCVSTIVTAPDGASQSVPLKNHGDLKEIVQKQPARTKDFDADDNPLPTVGCCLCCLDPNLCNLCCGCDCSDCAVCYWCLSCDCCLECDECCTQCLANCV